MRRSAVRAGLAAALSVGLLGLGGCVKLGLVTASTNISRQEAARPPISFIPTAPSFGPSLAESPREYWTETEAPALRAAFEQNVYGPVPKELKGHEAGRRVVDADFANGAGVLEEVAIRVGEAPDAPVFRVAIAFPKSASAEHPAPLILGEMFCANIGAMGTDKLTPPGPGGRDCRNSGTEARIIRLIFGKYIIESPVEMILKRGYAFAVFHPGEVASDSQELAPSQLDRLGAMLPPDRKPQGVIAVWAAAFGWVLDVMDQDKRLEPAHTAVYGHSRDGKAALLAAAFDPRIDAVISHQSGKGGATLTRSFAGESVKEITASYPHWFAPAYAAFADKEEAIPVDQHQLIALVAPRPILLGNGWKDVWSDPNGSFRAALGAEPAYELFGEKGLAQMSMTDTAHYGAVDFYIRNGGHGVRQIDWEHFLDFCDRWFKQDAHP